MPSGEKEMPLKPSLCGLEMMRQSRLFADLPATYAGPATFMLPVCHSFERS
jgi:hypothetical protein